jgi:hypothetical protein
MAQCATLIAPYWLSPIALRDFRIMTKYFAEPKNSY